MDTLVRYEAEGPVARLTLDSPSNRNALSTALVEQLHDGLTRASAQHGVRVVVLGHTGGTFCAGADIGEAAGHDPADLAVERAQDMTRLLRRILESPLPVIAAIDGHVRAGGLGLVGACDIAVAGSASTFALTEARIGVAPSIISLTLLPKMTARAAGRYFVTGEKFGAQAAAETGLITVATDDVAATVTELAAAVAQGSPQGLAESKRLTTAAILADFDLHAEKLTQRSAALFVSEEAREGMLAFLQKRRPDWAG
ncbi:MAG: enoyl-CoA hydratase family protein [Mycobacterium sp.]